MARSCGMTKRQLSLKPNAPAPPLTCDPNTLSLNLQSEQTDVKEFFTIWPETSAEPTCFLSEDHSSCVCFSAVTTVHMLDIATG